MAALYKMNNLWIRKDGVKQSTKLKLYKTLVKLVLLYNPGIWSPTQKEEEDLDGFQRKQLSGHVLRIFEETPAFKSLLHYFSNSDAPKFRGRPRNNLPWKLNQDL